MADSFRGKRVTIMGLGTRGGGLGVARYLAAQGAIVTVTDRRSHEDLEASIRELDGLPIRYVLGRHDERDFTRDGADIVVRNPGVRRNNPLLQLAREQGVAIEMEMSLFFRACPAPIIGITGTKGKTTTSTICAEMLRAWDPRTVLAGNMGISALDQLPQIAADTPVIIEISSWQLEALDEHRLAPHMAVLTNISEDHLDAYDGFADYAATKRTVAHHQEESDVLVVNRDEEETWRASRETKARVVPFGTSSPSESGMWVEGSSLVWRLQERQERIEIPDNPALTGSRQALNAAAAAAAALLRGAPVSAVSEGLWQFSGIKDRFERVAEVDGVEYINDTSATAPVAAIAALERLHGRRIHLIAGGAGKQSDLSHFADAVRESVYRSYLLEGSATPDLRALLVSRETQIAGFFTSMEDAVGSAAIAAMPGDVVLLSPGCASFGLFRDEFDRGEKFREAVKEIQRDRKRTWTLSSAGPTIELLPPSPGPVHFVGIGGIGMSALARILHAWGYYVTGSDTVSSEVTRALEAEGINVSIGHTAVTDAPSAELVVVTAAVRSGNPEIEAATSANVPIVKRAQLLGMLANERECVAVAGTHGKSTTSGMIASALIALEADPSYAIGAIVASTGTNAAPGSGEAMIVEADEYDYSFLSLKPDVAVVTNVEFDHPDLFPDQATYDAAFEQFIEGIRPGGTLIIAADDPGCSRILGKLDRAGLEIQTFGEQSGADWLLFGAEGDWRVRAPSGEEQPLQISIPGRHNARNATAAVAAIAALGYRPDEAIAALSAYQGVGRRFETKGEASGVIVIDDYAHHPSEVRATLRAARERFGEKRIWAVFQPHTFSRTKALLHDFADSFSDADRIVILDIYPSRETDSLGISSSDLIRLLPNGALAVGTPAEAVELLGKLVERNDIVLTLGAGDVTSIGPKLLDHLRTRATSPGGQTPPVGGDGPRPEGEKMARSAG